MKYSPNLVLLEADDYLFFNPIFYNNCSNCVVKKLGCGSSCTDPRGIYESVSEYTGHAYLNIVNDDDIDEDGEKVAYLKGLFL